MNNLPLSKSHRRGGSSGSHVEVQSKSFPEASGPSLALLTRLDLRKRKARAKGMNAQMWGMLMNEHSVPRWQAFTAIIIPMRKDCVMIKTWF